MPAFTIKDTNQLADWLIPVTPEMAAEIVATANKANDGNVHAVVYYYGGASPEKRIRRNILINLTLEFDSGFLAYVVTGDYHPRKNGVADLIYKTDTYIHD